MTAISSEVGDVVRNGAYATDWNDFIGQDKAKRMLKMAAMSARSRDAVLGHVLLKSATPGIGKTSLALLLALEMGRGVRLISGKVTAGEARMILSDMAEGDILVIDEIHQLANGGRANSEWLLHYLEKGTLIGPMGPENVPRVTIVGATTDAGRLPGPVLQRFTYQPVLEDYSDNEGALIALKLAMRVLAGTDVPVPSDEVCVEIAAAGSNQPRIMRSIIESIRDFVICGEMDPDPDYNLGPVLDMCELTTDGLTRSCQQYLRVMVNEYRGQPAGAKPLQDRIGEMGDAFAETERLLMAKGYVVKGKTGRQLTQPGIKRCRELVTA